MSEQRPTQSKALRNTLVGTLAGLAVVGGYYAHEKLSEPSDHGAAKISTELYDTKDFPKGVPVPGILNGIVTVKSTSGGSPEITYTNPVLLESDKDSSLDGAWIGIPEATSNGHVALHPVQIHEGVYGSETTSVQLNVNESNSPVLYGAAIYPTSVDGSHDVLAAFDIQGNGNFPSVMIDATVAK